MSALADPALRPADPFAAAERRAGERRRGVLACLSLAPVDRLSDRARDAIEQLVRDHVDATLDVLRRAAARRGIAAIDLTVAARRQVERAALADPVLAAALDTAARLAILDEELRWLPSTQRAAGRLAAIIDGEDAAFAGRARAYIAAVGGQVTPLPATATTTLAWLVAAACRGAGVADSALALAGEDVTAQWRGGATLHSLAAGVAADVTGQVPAALGELLAEGQSLLFAALLARTAGLRLEASVDLLLDPAGEPLWIALRAIGCGRAEIATIGFLLCEADPARDLDRFVVELDRTMAQPAESARAAIAPLAVDPAFRAAARALAVAA